MPLMIGVCPCCGKVVEWYEPPASQQQAAREEGRDG
jgi:hypothetical protein